MHSQQCSSLCNSNLIIDESFKGIQQEIDLSFKRIDDLIDQIVVDNEQLLNKQLQECQWQRVVQQNESSHRLSSLNIDNSQFSNQMIVQIRSLIKMSIDNQIKIQSIEYQQQLNENQEIQKIQKKQLNETIKHQQLQSNQQQIQQLTLNQFQYQLLPNSIKQQQFCFAIATNKDCSIVVAGCDNTIKVFEFKSEVLIQTQLLSEHKSSVLALNFMKKSNQFISGSQDNLIIIWIMNPSNQWVCQYKLIGHNNNINCLVLNNNEDLIISGSYDKTIKFWIKKNEWLCQQTITDHNGSIYGLSLNSEQNKLISFGNGQILIIEQSQQDSQWIVKQKIQVQTYGFRLCFINDNVFTFQPQSSEQMHVYEMNDTNKQYLKTNDVLVKYSNDSYSLFPQQYIKSKWLLVNKNGNYVNLITINQNREFKIQQSIQFRSARLFGHMSDNGQYLITWDDNSKEIQIRKYHQI